MAKAKQLPSGSWRVLLFVGLDDNGKRRYESFTAPTRTEAELMANTRKNDLEHGGRVSRVPAEMTLGEAIDQYIDSRSMILSPQTVREYRKTRRHYLSGIMDTKLRRLKQNDIQREINREAGHLSPKTVRNVWGLVSSALKSVGFKETNITLPAPIKYEVHIPTDKQVEALFERVEGSNIEIPVVLAATCGLRRGEIAALDLNKDIDYEKRLIKITKAVGTDENGNFITKTPKTFTSMRSIEAPEWVIQKLAEARDNGYVMPTINRISSGFKKATEHLKLNGIRFHDLRHYYASLMLKLGVPDLYAMRRMGHATTNMLKTVYQHIMDDKEKEVSEQLSSFWTAFDAQRVSCNTKCNTDLK